MHKRQAVFAVLLLFATPFCLSQTPSPAAKSTTAPRPDSDTFVNNVYTNSYFGLSFSLGDGWERATRPSDMRGSFNLLVAARNSANHPYEGVQLTADDASEYHPRPNLQQWSQNFAQHAKDSKQMQLLKDMYPVEYAGQSFYSMKYKQMVQGRSFYGYVVVTEYKGFFLYWTFIALSEENLETNVDSLRTLSFQNPRK